MRKKLFKKKGILNLCKAYSYSSVVTIGPMILGILYTTGVMGKIYAFKMRLLHGGKEG